jgi:hypothetical protein
MTHPNRAWRRRMHEAAQQWLDSWSWHPEQRISLMDQRTMHDHMLRCYCDGYIAGRKSTTKQPEQPA